MLLGPLVVSLVGRRPRLPFSALVRGRRPQRPGGRGRRRAAAAAAARAAARRRSRRRRRSRCRPPRRSSPPAAARADHGWLGRRGAGVGRGKGGGFCGGLRRRSGALQPATADCCFELQRGIRRARLHSSPCSCPGREGAARARCCQRRAAIYALRLQPADCLKLTGRLRGAFGVIATGCATYDRWPKRKILRRPDEGTGPRCDALLDASDREALRCATACDYLMKASPPPATPASVVRTFVRSRSPLTMGWSGSATLLEKARVDLLDVASSRC